MKKTGYKYNQELNTKQVNTIGQQTNDMTEMYPMKKQSTWQCMHNDMT